MRLSLTPLLPGTTTYAFLLLPFLRVQKRMEELSDAEEGVMLADESVEGAIKWVASARTDSCGTQQARSALERPMLSALIICFCVC